MRFVSRFWIYSGFAVVLNIGSAMAQEQLSLEEQQRLAAADEAASLSELTLPFFDPFDGRELGDVWDVKNQDLEKYLVEAGEIFVLQAGGTAKPSNPEADNIFTLNGRLPDVDYTMAVRAKLETKTGEEAVWLGLREDENNYLAAQFRAQTKGCGTALYLHIQNVRVMAVGEKPQVTSFTTNIFDGPLLKHICSKGPRAVADEALKAVFEQGFELGFHRVGFQYFASVTMDLPALGDRPAGVFTYRSRPLARTEPFGQPFFMLGQSTRAKAGESTAMFQELRIEAAQ